ncbi:MAG TPA: AmmeMemoRadiSam system protein B [Vicinamibacterales bacterium]
MQQVRRAAVAGQWYPGKKARLAQELDAHLAAAVVGLTDTPHLRAIIAPHAGLMYSGGVAAYAYKAAQGGRYRSVVLVGPSHFVPFEGVSIWPAGAWETPFGEVPIDGDLASAIQAASPAVTEYPAAHGREHSIEMQMPFLAHLMDGVPIVPLVMGYQTRDTAATLGDALARAIAPRADEVLLVASSDLSHYEDAETAGRLDAVVTDRVEALDPHGLMTALEREPRHACGGGPMVAVLRAARSLGARHARVLRYADSGDVSGDKSSVVGYMAAAIW